MGRCWILRRSGRTKAGLRRRPTLRQRGRLGLSARRLICTRRRESGRRDRAGRINCAGGLSLPCGVLSCRLRSGTVLTRQGALRLGIVIRNNSADRRQDFIHGRFLRLWTCGHLSTSAEDVLQTAPNATIYQGRQNRTYPSSMASRAEGAKRAPPDATFRQGSADHPNCPAPDYSARGDRRQEPSSPGRWHQGARSRRSGCRLRPHDRAAQ